SITSVLQYMSSKKVLWVLESRSFLNLFMDIFPDIPFSKILILLTVNLSVSKKISGLPVTGPVRDWLFKQNEMLGIADDSELADTVVQLPPPAQIERFSAALSAAA
ncbi:MAG: hypothetical protein GX776_08315, partial [Oxalobacter sp.]|nr:hypothetical protein [Oxalobacter sp.]